MGSYWQCVCKRSNEWFEDECAGCGRAHREQPRSYDPGHDVTRAIIAHIQASMARIEAALLPERDDRPLRLPESEIPF